MRRRSALFGRPASPKTLRRAQGFGGVGVSQRGGATTDAPIGSQVRAAGGAQVRPPGGQRLGAPCPGRLRRGGRPDAAAAAGGPRQPPRRLRGAAGGPAAAAALALEEGGSGAEELGRGAAEGAGKNRDMPFGIHIYSIYYILNTI